MFSLQLLFSMFLIKSPILLEEASRQTLFIFQTNMQMLRRSERYSSFQSNSCFPRGILFLCARSLSTFMQHLAKNHHIRLRKAIHDVEMRSHFRHWEETSIC